MKLKELQYMLRSLQSVKTAIQQPIKGYIVHNAEAVIDHNLDIIEKEIIRKKLKKLKK